MLGIGLQVRHRPLGRVLPGPRRDQPVRLPFLPQEAEHGGQRRQADLAVAQPGRIQPRLVELEPGGEQIGDALVQARNEETSHAGLNHGRAPRDFW